MILFPDEELEIVEDEFIEHFILSNRVVTIITTLEMNDTTSVTGYAITIAFF